MWYRDMKWANDIGKMALIVLLNSRLLTDLQFVKYVISVIKQSTINDACIQSGIMT